MERHIESPTLNSFVCGCTSGIIAAMLTHPFDVVKTIDQVGNSQPVSVSTAIRQIVNEHGWRGLYVGLAPRLAKVAPACGIMISCYEVGKMMFQDSGCFVV
jgi:solute carrier family 25, member 39/40